MIKKLNVIVMIFLLLLILPYQASASGRSREYYPPLESDYFQKKTSYQLYISFGTKKVRFTQYKPNLPMDEANVITTVTWNVKENSFVWVDMRCKGALSIQYLDETGNIVDSELRGETTSYLNEGSCAASDAVTPSDFNEQEDRYKSDTFGGTKTPLTSPSTADGSGGTGSTAYEGVDTGNGGGTGGGGDTGGGTDPGGDDPGGDTSGECDSCKVFDCPGWDEYMGKLDEIRNAIPPAPNWNQVADTFRDSIVPRVISDLGDLLGSAPAKPSIPAPLPSVSDGGLSSRTPSMPDVPGLGESGFNAGDIKNQAPTIHEREDPTGGFDLIANPMDTLPDLPDSFPKPGSTDPGEWGQNKPTEQDNPFPFPEDQGDPDIGNPPKPGDNGATPPSSGGDPGSAPTPGGDVGNAPTPGGTGEDPNMKDYKPSPGAPDGSGGIINP